VKSQHSLPRSQPFVTPHLQATRLERKVPGVPRRSINGVWCPPTSTLAPAPPTLTPPPQAQRCGPPHPDTWSQPAFPWGGVKIGARTPCAACS
jgi:hypothetical protein